MKFESCRIKVQKLSFYTSNNYFGDERKEGEENGNLTHSCEKLHKIHSLLKEVWGTPMSKTEYIY